MKDDTVLSTVRPISDLSELYSQFAEYRLEILEERVREQLRKPKGNARGAKKLDTGALKAFITEQEEFLADMNREIVDDSMVVKGLMPVIA